MPKRTDIKSVMVIGSGPIVIGQAAEFDYSGTQACRVLREEGIRVILVNSNPATIMTDPEMADATYIEPIATPILEQIIAKERPDALLPTLGGQTALNAAMALGEAGVLKKYNVELIGASLEAIDRGEDRELFKKVVDEAGAESARSDIAHSIEEVDKIAEKFGYPLVVRPSFTMGGLGSDAAIEAADIVLMDDKPSKLADAIRIARRTLAIVRQNIVFALAVKFLVLALSAAGVANMWEAVFADVGVSVIAILNAMRALKTVK